MIVTIDIDGVIADTTDADFNPKRTALEYYNKPKHPSLDLGILNRLISQYQVYFVSARSFENALSTTRRWLYNVGVNVEECIGVLCAEGTRGMGDGVGSKEKAPLLKYLGTSLHIDDHSSIISEMGSQGLLFYNQHYEGNVKLYEEGGPFFTAKDWPTIERIARELYVKRGYC